MSIELHETKEDLTRDMERVKEYEMLYPQYYYREPKVVEVSTGLIIAARFADKIRRIMFAVFGKILPEDVILRDVSEFNKKLYKIMVDRKIDKLDIVRIRFKVGYDPEGKKLIFEEPQITRYVEESKLKECEEALDALKKILDIASKAVEGK
jgi:hypothetical protein